MSLYNFTLDSDPIGEEELNILSQKSNHSQFHAEEDADFENEDESQEIYSSDKFSSQEFSQVLSPLKLSHISNEQSTRKYKQVF